MKYIVDFTTQFKKDIKLAKKKVPILINYHRLVGDTLSWAAPNLHSKQMLEEAIAKGYSLRHDAFGMTGDYKDCRECHIEPDWLLIYKKYESELILMLVRTGSHSDLF